MWQFNWGSNDFEIVYNLAHLDKEFVGYREKLLLIRQLMLSHLEVEWIWWTDCDAQFIDMVFEIPLSNYSTIKSRNQM
uniref:Uncharacterized protein n=1 Tax=Nelumbo nucifera TaxID=4432 RepID=A0A822YGH8_NELNU|nr:TPA_asm: hypothetical protein HUJ06_009200 [Nelumbo nucifera]